jgi:DNA-binding GntR family transcriptional regulator
MIVNVFDLIEPISKKDRIVETMKKALLTGKLSPGEQIVESKVARQLGVGTPLVREALIELEHQGFVQKFPYKGTYVTRLSRQDIEQIYNLRIELEPIAVEWAQARAGPPDIEALLAIASHMRQGAAEMNFDHFYEYDLALHRKIWELAGNHYLFEVLERLVVPLFAFFVMRTPRVRETYVESAETHKRIIDAMLTKDGLELRSVAREAMISFKNDWLTTFGSELE